jgi:hypothetical protein
MRKPKIKPLIPLIRSRPQIIIFLLLAHCIPFLIPRAIPPDIVALDENCHHHIPRDESKEDFVSPSVVGFIIFSVDL